MLRVVQYLTLHSQDQGAKGATHNVYTQMRRTRKILRFLRTLQHTTQIRKEVSALIKEGGSVPTIVLKVLSILEHLFTVLFFVFDHRVFLGELEVISKDSVSVYYPRSMQMYRLQNIFGALRSLAEIAVMVIEGKYEGELLDMEKGKDLILGRAVDFLKNILDILVASYYLTQPKGAAASTGVIGVITSLVAICQALKVI